MSYYDRPSQWQINQWIYWGNDETSPQCLQMGLNAEIHPDGVLVSGDRPDGGQGELILPFDAVETFAGWVRDHSARMYAIFEKQVTCPECGSTFCTLLRRNYPLNDQFQFKCTDGHEFHTNYRGYWEGERKEPAPSVAEHDAYYAAKSTLKWFEQYQEALGSEQAELLRNKTLVHTLQTLKTQLEKQYPNDFGQTPSSNVKETPNEDLGDLDDQPF